MFLNRMTKFRILIPLFVLFYKPPFAEGWAVGPVDYHFNIENAMTDIVLNVHCKSHNDDLGLVRLPVHSNYTHTFRAQIFKTVTFNCELNTPGSVQKTFNAFKDVIEFVDNECGGRHCFWKANDDGLYLYQIHQRKYIKKYDWEQAPPDDEDPKEMDE